MPFPCPTGESDLNMRAVLNSLSATILAAAVLFATTATAGKAPFYVPSKAEKEGADYGEFPSNYKELVVAYMEKKHKTPDGARYQFIGDPAKGTNWAKRREDVIWCYHVSAQINPDRSWNGYSLWTFFIRDGKIIGEYKT
jgi:hypothetical protein